MVAEAELLEVADKVMTVCQGGSSHIDYELHVSHESGGFPRLIRWSV
jgi:hypothetical protein